MKQIRLALPRKKKVVEENQPQEPVEPKPEQSIVLKKKRIKKFTPAELVEKIKGDPNQLVAYLQGKDEQTVAQTIEMLINSQDVNMMNQLSLNKTYNDIGIDLDYVMKNLSNKAIFGLWAFAFRVFQNNSSGSTVLETAIKNNYPQILPFMLKVLERWFKGDIKHGGFLSIIHAVFDLMPSDTMRAELIRGLLSGKSKKQLREFYQYLKTQEVKDPATARILQKLLTKIEGVFTEQELTGMSMQVLPKNKEFDKMAEEEFPREHAGYLEDKSTHHIYLDALGNLVEGAPLGVTKRLAVDMSEEEINKVVSDMYDKLINKYGKTPEQAKEISERQRRKLMDAPKEQTMSEPEKIRHEFITQFETEIPSQTVLEFLKNTVFAKEPNTDKYDKIAQQIGTKEFWNIADLQKLIGYSTINKKVSSHLLAQASTKTIPTPNVLAYVDRMVLGDDGLQKNKELVETIKSKQTWTRAELKELLGEGKAKEIDDVVPAEEIDIPNKTVLKYIDESIANKNRDLVNTLKSKKSWTLKDLQGAVNESKIKHSLAMYENGYALKPIQNFDHKVGLSTKDTYVHNQVNNPNAFNIYADFTTLPNSLKPVEEAIMGTQDNGHALGNHKTVGWVNLTPYSCSYETEDENGKETTVTKKVLLACEFQSNLFKHFKYIPDEYKERVKNWFGDWDKVIMNHTIDFAKQYGYDEIWVAAPEMPAERWTGNDIPKAFKTLYKDNPIEFFGGKVMALPKNNKLKYAGQFRIPFPYVTVIDVNNAVKQKEE